MWTKPARKGQVVVYDFIFGFTAFILVITVVSVMWFQTTSRVGVEDFQDEKFRLARGTAFSLISSPGYPENWEHDEECFTFAKNCTIGLALTPNHLSPDKLNRFISMHNGGNNYSEVRQMLGLQGYNYNFALRNSAGVRQFPAGVSLAGNLSVSVTRMVILDGQVYRLEFGLY